MPDFKKMTVQSLRELARKVLGPGQSRLKTKAELVNALEEAGASPGARPETGEKPAAARVRTAAARAGEPGKKAAKASADEAAKPAKAAPARASAKPARGSTRKAVARVEQKVEQAKEAAAAGGKRMAARATRAAGKAVKAAAAAVAAVEAVVDEVKKGTRRVAAGARRRVRPKSGPDPEGYFVARVRGEDAARSAPHPLTESDADEAPDLEEGTPATPAWDEQLGDLPWGYADDAFVALARDPRTLYLYWDHSNGAVAQAVGGLDRPRTQLWIFARAGAGWERMRVVEFALESRGYYVHDLEPGRVYRAEIHVVDRRGQERLVGAPSNEAVLPRVGPSPVVDDRFIRIPWSVSLGRLLGPGHAGGPFSDEARALLARLSDWSRFTSKAVWGGSAGEVGERPSSPTSAASAPTSPSSPAGGSGPRE